MSNRNIKEKKKRKVKEGKEEKKRNMVKKINKNVTSLGILNQKQKQQKYNK